MESEIGYERKVELVAAFPEFSLICILFLILSWQLFEVAERTRPKDAAAVKYIELNEHLGHKFICNSKKLPEILR